MSREPLFPLHKILWRLIWHAPMIASCALFLAFVTIRNGPREARDIWSHI